MGQCEKWLVDPYRAGREDAAKAQARYRAVGGQENHSLLENAKLYLAAAEHFISKGYLNLAAYYLDLVKEHISLLEAKEEKQEQETQQPEATTFTEAPASFNVKAISPQGFDVMLTLRDDDTASLVARAEGALSWLVEQGFTPTPQRYSNSGKSNQASGNSSEAPLCPAHGKPMLASKKGEGYYCPVKIADDDGTGKPVYCKQRVK